jgi:hypothetical protein
MLSRASLFRARSQFAVISSLRSLAPLSHEVQCSRLQAAREHRAVYSDRGTASCVIRMKMGHGVITFIPVHVDHHSVERTDTWHGPTIAACRSPGTLITGPAFSIHRCNVSVAPAASGWYCCHQQNHSSPWPVHYYVTLKKESAGRWGLVLGGVLGRAGGIGCRGGIGGPGRELRRCRECG